MRFALSVAALVVMVGCVPPQPPKETYYDWPAPADPEATVKQWMAENLKDPDSVKGYQWLGIQQDRTGKWVAKASWNAKNSYGGYTGMDTHFLCFTGNRITMEFTQSYIDRLNNARD